MEINPLSTMGLEKVRDNFVTSREVLAVVIIEGITSKMMHKEIFKLVGIPNR